MLEDWASRPSPWRSRASTADLVVTVSLFVATALAGIAAVLIGWVFVVGTATVMAIVVSVTWVVVAEHAG
ncbi:hypothetical protein NYS50_04665 [Curtobacterium flaccumfaciens pv. flaccumfaciens]|uniref:hypothetical protein n=1 Tax=Curtobacterium flaccumfaciens TaxID=2035 RepID=UPI00217E660C|nr:hypothetical protein [Curtobacterium flaccumfaciens]MCS6547164.1 hypothetical protein [Curtobacterium flaccumfaciens pv. flaccumfaciens]